MGVNPIAVWTAADSPNNTAPPPDGNGWSGVEVVCGDADPGNLTTGCLFDIRRDPEEREDLGGLAEHRGTLRAMLRRYAEIAATAYDPDRGDAAAGIGAVCGAYNAFGGFVGPYLP